MDDFHVAYKCVGDLKEKKLSEAYGILAWRSQHGDFWFRSNCLSKVLGLGTTQKLCDSTSLSAEAQYDLAGGKVKGIMDKPLFLRAGVTWALANKTKMNMFLWARDTVHLTAKFE